MSSRVWFTLGAILVLIAAGRAVQGAHSPALWWLFMAACTIGQGFVRRSDEREAQQAAAEEGRKATLASEARRTNEGATERRRLRPAAAKLVESTEPIYLKLVRVAESGDREALGEAVEVAIQTIRDTTGCETLQEVKDLFGVSSEIELLNWLIEQEEEVRKEAFGESEAALAEIAATPDRSSRRIGRSAGPPDDGDVDGHEHRRAQDERLESLARKIERIRQDLTTRAKAEQQKARDQRRERARQERARREEAKRIEKERRNRDFEDSLRRQRERDQQRRADDARKRAEEKRKNEHERQAREKERREKAEYDRREREFEIVYHMKGGGFRIVPGGSALGARTAAEATLRSSSSTLGYVIRNKNGKVVGSG